MWLVPQVREALDRGLHVIVILPDGDGRLARALALIMDEEPNLRVCPIRFDFRVKLSLATMLGVLQVRAILRKCDADTVLYHLYASALVTRLATFGLKGVRKVHMVAGPLYLESRPIRWVERILWRLDTMIIAGSRYTYRRYVELGVSAKRICVVPYGVDTERFSPEVVVSSDSARKALDIDDGVFVVVMVAYIYAPKSLVFPGVGIKGHELALEAWMEFAKEFPNSELIFVGSGFDSHGQAHREALVAQARRINLARPIRWIESLADVRTVYAASDLSISPSLSENHGAVLEASAMSVPSVVSDAGALPEALAPGAGWVFASGHAEKLAGRLREAHAAWLGGELPHMGELARIFVERHFSAQRCAQHVVDVVSGEGAPGCGTGGSLR